MRGRRRAGGRLAACLLASCLLASCAESRDAGEADLLLLAAAGLSLVLEELVPAYEARTGDRVAVVLGSSGNLAAQIRYGAPADLFFAADESFMDGLVESGHIEPASRTVYAVGRLALVVPPGREPPAALEALIDPRFGVIAIASPEHAPYGRAAQEALEAAGLWESLEARIVVGENVAQALQFVRTANADAGLVALSLVQEPSADGDPDEGLSYSVVDAALHAPLRQVAGIPVDRGPGTERARAFLDFVLSPEGQEILARYGLEPPAPAGSVPSGPYR